MNKLAFVAFACITAAIATTGLYLVLNYVAIPLGIKWYLFGLHLLFAAIGVALGFIGICMKRWICGIGVLVCLYFLLIQLAGL